MPGPTQYDGSVHLALNAGTSNDEQTRLTTETTQSDGNFRGLTDMRIIPVKEDGTILSPLGESLNRVGETTFMVNEVSDLTIGTRSFYAYARAACEGTPDPATNGRLSPDFTTAPTSTVVDGFPVNIPSYTFAPIAINTEGTATSNTSKANLIAAYMTSIATAGNWHTESEDSDLKTLFERFVNKKDATFTPLAGSDANILTYVNAWYKTVNTTADTDLRTAILNSMTNSEYVTCVSLESGKDSITALKGTTGNEYDMTGFPISLPDGAAALVWDNSIPAFRYTDENNKLSDYVYPAELWYYTDSRIYTSNSSRGNDYKTKNSWDDVLATYENRGTDGTGAVVDAGTRSVALVDPLRYGVANLCICLQADAEKDGDTYYIRDGNEEYSQSRIDFTKTAGETIGSFPLTAVLVGSQPATMDYKFEPKNPTDNTEREYVIYDKSIATEKICLADFIGKDEAGREHYSSPVYTLALQTKAEAPVKIVLEFENNSGQPFLNTEQSVIYPGTKFYLVAEVIAPATTDYNRQVFAKGYQTTLRFTIRSLAQAYNALPNLRSNNLRVFTTQQAGIREWATGITQDHSVYNW